MDNLEKIVFSEGVREIASNSMVGYCNKLTTIVLPDSLELISGASAFSDITALTTIELPEGLKFGEEEGYYFSDCTSLESTVLPASVTFIPDGMFSGCTSLTTVVAEGTITEIGENAFMEAESLTTLPDLSNVTVIGSQAFRECSSLTGIELGSVTELGSYAFYGCNSLSGELDLSGLTEIPEGAFSGVGSVTVTLGDSLTSIGMDAFSYSGLAGKVTIPESVTEIGENAFKNTEVTEFYIGSGVKELPSGSLASVALEKVTVNNSKDGIKGIENALPYYFDAEDVVYLHVSIGDDEGDTISPDSEITLQQAVNAGGTVKIEKHVKLSAPVTVPAGVNVTITADENWQIIGTSATTTSIENLFKVESGASVEFTGNVILSGRNNKESIIDNAGTVTLSGNASVQDGTPAANSSVIDTHGAGAAFIIKGGSVQNNTVSGANVGTVEIGGGARFEMSGGSISGNKWTTGTAYASTPGVLLYNNASGTMSGGYISNNRGCRGTGILLYGYGDVRTSFTMTGGYITGNTGVNSGNVTASGAVHVENNAEFNMSGGEISGNTGYSGGGVTVVDGKVQNGSGSWEDTEFNMTAGAISGNRANGSGGGVYSEGNFDNYSTMHIYYALVTNNTANQGGGLWYCVTGSTTVYVHEGCAVYENTANDAGDDFVIGGESSGKYTATLANRMLGGGAVKWYRDGGVYTSGSTLIPSVNRDIPRYGQPGADTEPVTVNNSDGSHALKAIAGEDAKELAKHEATLVISGNTASHGGGIGANGGVIIGEPGETQLSVNKEWAGGEGQERPESVTVELLNGGYVIDSAVLNADNNWSYTFTGLPAGGDYSVREAEKIPGYESAVSGDAENGFTITNTWVGGDEPEEPGEVSISVEKVWRGGGFMDRPRSVNIVLLRDGEFFGAVELSRENGWKHTFTGLPAADEDGNEYEYSVVEAPVDGYESEVSGSAEEGFVITNTRVDEPDWPDWPGPDEPDEPDEPDVPDEPDEPDEPDTPEGPDEPDEPDTPDTPENPDGEKLPQTGQPWWPVLLLSLGGAIMLLAGLASKRRYRGRHEV